MRWLSLLLVASCGLSSVDTGTMYQCQGVFICYGDHFGLTLSKGCAESLEHAVELYTEAAMDLTKEAKCGEDYEIQVSCKELGDTCIYKED